MDAQLDTRGGVTTALVNGFSIELIPSSKQRVAAMVENLPKGTEVFLPFAASTRPDELVAAAVELRHAGMTPVPHIPARRIKSGVDLCRFVEALTAKANVSSVLVLGGDIERPAGPFSSSIEILKFGVLSDNGISKIGFAGHPEGHPNVPADELNDAMRAKLKYTRELGADPFIVSQFSFSAQSFLDWQSFVIGPLSNAAPIRFGVPGLAGIRTLMRFAVECGVSTSFDLVRKNVLKAFKLAAEFQPGEVISELALGLPDVEQNQRFGVHFYPFGSFKRTSAWASAVSEGRHRMSDRGEIVVDAND